MQEKDTLYVLNKIDRVPEPGLIRLWQRRLEPAVALSARTGAGTGDLIAYINSWMTRRMPRVCLRLPLTEGSAIDRIYKNGTVLHSEYRGADVLLEAQLDYAVAQSLRAVFHTAVQKKTCKRKMLMNYSRTVPVLAALAQPLLVYAAVARAQETPVPEGFIGRGMARITCRGC